jgi:hypothetical protein
MYYHCIFMFEAILGVEHDLSTLYQGCFIDLGALRDCSTRFSSYKKAKTPHLSNHNTHLWRIIISCILFLSLHHGLYMCTFGILI